MTAVATDAGLAVTDLHAGYGPVTALEGVTLDVGRGELVALLGANGAGKTTTLRVLSGTLPARSGSVAFGGADATGWAASARVAAGLVHVPEGRHVFGDLSVEENLLVGGLVKKGRRHLGPELERAYELFPVLGERRRQPAATLSGGQQQMLAIARGLMSGPTTLMLDEPSLGLAPKVVDDVYATVHRLNEELGLSVLLVEQNAALAAEIADRIYLLQAGRVVGEGPAGEFADDEHFRRAYLGVQ